MGNLMSVFRPPQPQPTRLSWIYKVLASARTSSSVAAPPPPHPHSMAERIVSYLLTVLPTVMSLLPSYCLLRQGDISITIKYFSVPSLLVGMANSLVWLLHDVMVATNSSAATLVCNRFILASDFHILVAYLAARCLTRLGYGVGCLLVIFLLVILGFGQWKVNFGDGFQLFFVILTIALLVFSNGVQMLDLVNSPASRITRQIGALTIAPNFVFNTLNFFLINCWHDDHVLEQVTSGISVVVCLLEIVLLLVFKGRDMEIPIRAGAVGADKVILGSSDAVEMNPDAGAGVSVDDAHDDDDAGDDDDRPTAASYFFGHHGTLPSKKFERSLALPRASDSGQQKRFSVGDMPKPYQRVSLSESEIKEVQDTKAGNLAQKFQVMKEEPEIKY